MKSKRVTKLLACVLSAAMCTTPVWASSVEYGDKSGKGGVSGQIDTEMGVYSPVVSVNVPTKARIEVNPLVSSNSASVNGYGIASKSLVITNKSYDADNSTKIPIVITADAELQSKVSDVKVYYDKTRSGYTASDNSTSKEVYMSISEGNFRTEGLSDNVTYKTANKKSDVVTTAGSQIALSVSGPNSGDETYAAFAIVGDANVNAPWQKDDLKIGLSYAIRPGSTGVKNKLTAGQVLSGNTSASDAVEATSANGISLNGFPENGVEGSFVEKIIIHPTNAGEEDWALDANNEAEVKWEQRADSSWNLKIEDTDSCAYYVENYIQKGKTLDILLRLDDGRTLMLDLPLT